MAAGISETTGYPKAMLRTFGRLQASVQEPDSQGQKGAEQEPEQEPSRAAERTTVEDRTGGDLVHLREDWRVQYRIARTRAAATTSVAR